MRLLACTLALAGLASCSFIEVQPGAYQVAVFDAAQAAGCKPIGETTVSALDRVGFIDRDPAKVDADLLKLARNSALKLGGDTLVPGERLGRGERRYSVYRCR